MDTSGVMYFNDSLMKINSTLNTSAQTSNVLDLSYPLYMMVFVTLCFVVLFITGIGGNLMVIVVVAQNRRMFSSTNLFLVNLSAVDLAAILFCVPSAMSEFYGKDVWYLGGIMCKFVFFLEYTVVSTSVLIILAISFERYYVICRPLQAKYMCTTGRTIKTVIVIWLLGIILNSPFLKMANLVDTNMATTSDPVQVCKTDISPTWTRFYIISNVFLFFVLPFVILLFLYGRIIRCLLMRDDKHCGETVRSQEQSTRKRRRVVFMLISVVILFFTCLLPFRVLSVWLMYASQDDVTNLGFHGYYSLLYFSRIMFSINSAGNPIIYNLFSSKFRRAFRALLCSKYAHENNESFRSGQNETILLSRTRKTMSIN